MFDSLSDRLAGVFDKLRGRGALSEDDVRSAMREVRVALLEADVALQNRKSLQHRKFMGGQALLQRRLKVSGKFLHATAQVV